MATTKTASTEAHVTLMVDPKKILTHPKNPRRDATADTELLEAVRSQGVLMPLLLAPIPEDLDVSRRRSQEYVLVAGHRRLDAALRVKAKTVPAVVRDDLDTVVKQIEAMLTENTARQDLSVLEEGDAFLELLDLGLTQKQIHTDTGISKTRISERTRTARLPVKARTRYDDGQVTLDALLDLSRVDDPDLQARIAEQPTYLWDQEVRKALAAQQAAKEDKVRRAELQKAGVRVLDEVPGLGPDGEETWADLADLLDGVPKVAALVAAHEGVETDEAFVAGLEWERVEAWHSASCPGHAVLRTERDATSWAPARAYYDAICDRLDQHTDLLDEQEVPSADGEGPASSGARADADAGEDEDPAVAARRAHLEGRVTAQQAWVRTLIDNREWVVREYALQRALKQASVSIELDADGKPAQPWQRGTIKRIRALLGVGDDVSTSQVMDQYDTWLGTLDLTGLSLVDSHLLNGPAYGAEQMGTPGGFGHGWARDRVEFLHELGWEWDEQELDEIRKHPTLASSLDLDSEATS